MRFLRTFYYSLKPNWRLIARRLVYWPSDFKDQLLGKRPPMVPPKGLTFTGAGDFIQEGEKYATYFKQFGLQPHHQVLDVGCGLGRMAVPLTGFLNQSGGYLGFDIMPQAINWSKKAIASRFPNFQFQLYHGGNDLYNDVKIDLMPFPGASASFDFAILTSVFSHLQPDETLFFLQELNRCLKPGGTVFATFFIYAKEDRSPFNPAFAFPFDYDHYCLMSEKVKGANVAYRFDWLAKAIESSGLQVKKHLPGFWLNGKSSPSLEFQDILILHK